MVDSKTKKLMEKHGFKKLDANEMTRGEKAVPVPFPAPYRKYRIIYQTENKPLENIYYWIRQHIKEDWGLHEVIKIKDVFTATESSAFWGATQQRLQIQQGQVSQYMGTIANMVKGLFGIVREIRILKEKLISYKQADEGDESAEVLLRGYWIDLKDGGAKNPTSVYGMATQLGFSILPDLFFSTPLMKDAKAVDKYLKKLSSDFNRKVLEVLGRKLKAYLLWRENTYKELAAREKFTIKYLRQHYDTIQLYMSWVKPALRNVKRLQMNQEMNLSSELIGAFEGSTIEIEFLCHRHVKGDYHAVLLVTMDHRTRPKMDSHTQDYQHKGPIHEGRTEMILRGYAWTKKQIDAYVAMKEEESLELLSSIDSSVKEAMEGLGDEMKEYLKEAGEKFPDDERKEKEAKRKAEEAEKKAKKQNMSEPFVGLYDGAKEIFGSLIPIGELMGDKKKPQDEFSRGKDRGKAAKVVDLVIWQTFKNFKGSNGMAKW